MSAFELNNYELANDTIKRFWTEYPVGRIVPVIVDIDLVAGWVMFKVDVYREYLDLEPSATGHAYGNVSFYPANMKKWFIEDTETSAIARAIKLLTPSAERPSREDMMKVETLPPVPDAQDFWATKPEAAGIPTLGEAMATVSENLGAVATDPTPRCTHGSRVWKTGNKNNKAWAGYMCQEINRNNQCAPVWYELDSAGKWGVRK
jgi:hypothetical protein